MGIQQKLVDPVGHVPVGVILMGETLGAVTGRQGSAWSVWTTLRGPTVSGVRMGTTEERSTATVQVGNSEQ